MSLERLVTTIIKEAKDLLKCERCTFYLLDLKMYDAVSLYRWRHLRTDDVIVNGSSLDLENTEWLTTNAICWWHWHICLQNELCCCSMKLDSLQWAKCHLLQTAIDMCQCVCFFIEDPIPVWLALKTHSFSACCNSA